MWFIDTVLLHIDTVLLLIVILSIIQHLITLDENNLDQFDRESYISSVPEGGSRDCFGNIYDKQKKFLIWNTITETITYIILL